MSLCLLNTLTGISTSQLFLEQQAMSCKPLTQLRRVSYLLDTQSQWVQDNCKTPCTKSWVCTWSNASSTSQWAFWSVHYIPIEGYRGRERQYTNWLWPADAVYHTHHQRRLWSSYYHLRVCHTHHWHSLASGHVHELISLAVLLSLSTVSRLQKL